MATDSAEIDTNEGSCDWCGRAFLRHRGGKPQRFCSTRCRHDLDAAVRAYVARQLAAGQITIDDLKGDQSNAHVARGADPGVETGDGVSVGAEGLR